MTVAIEGVVTTKEAASRLGCSAAKVRAHVRSGHLEARRIGSQWVIDADALEEFQIAHVPVGRTFSSRIAWSLLVEFEGRTPLRGAHRQEAARVRSYREQPSEVLWNRLRGRATPRLLSVATATAGRMLADPRWVIGGVHAAMHHLGADGIDGIVTLYAPSSLEEEFFDASLAVPDPSAANLALMLVRDQDWPFDREIDRYAWGSIAFLDCREQGLCDAQLLHLWPPMNGNLEVVEPQPYLGARDEDAGR